MLIPSLLYPFCGLAALAANEGFIRSGVDAYDFLSQPRQIGSDGARQKRMRIRVSPRVCAVRVPGAPCRSPGPQGAAQMSDDCKS